MPLKFSKLRISNSLLRIWKSYRVKSTQCTQCRHLRVFSTVNPSLAGQLFLCSGGGLGLLIQRAPLALTSFPYSAPISHPPVIGTQHDSNSLPPIGTPHSPSTVFVGRFTGPLWISLLPWVDSVAKSTWVIRHLPAEFAISRLQVLPTVR